MSSSFSGVVGWLTTASNWTGSQGAIHRIDQHVGYSLEAMGVSVAIAIPLGLWTGHTGRGGGLLTSVGNAARALPTLGLLILLAVVTGSESFTVALIPLVLLAVPSILVNTYEGVRGVDPSLSDAARGMGLRPWQVLFRVEVPVALPLIVLGLRTAALQVIATATIAAEVGIGGLGRFIIDGEAVRSFPEVYGGAVLVAALAIVTEVLFIVAGRLLVSPGVRSRSRII